MATLEEYLQVRRGDATLETCQRVQAALMNPSSELNVLLKLTEEQIATELGWDPRQIRSVEESIDDVNRQETGDDSILASFFSIREGNLDQAVKERVVGELSNQDSELRKNLSEVTTRLAELLKRHQTGTLVFTDVSRVDDHTDIEQLNRDPPDVAITRAKSENLGFSTTTGTHSQSSNRRGKRVSSKRFYVRAVIASAIVIVCAWMIPKQFVADKSFQSLMAQAEFRQIAVRGDAEVERGVVVLSHRNGFALLVAMFSEESPKILPLGERSLVVSANTDSEFPPLPSGLNAAELFLVVLTEQPAREVVEGSLLSEDFTADRIEELKSQLTRAMKTNNYHWIAFAVLKPK